MRTAALTLSLALVTSLVPAAASAKKAADSITPRVTKDRVQMVFVLDTTGSMGGLIEGAKRKIWFIANEVLASKRQVDLEIGLVAYRDKGDAYITQKLPLTRDLDQVYTTLMGYRAGGGGDGPEHVNAGLDAAVNQMKWAKSKDVLKLVFLVGDAPPHMDYADDVKHTKTSQAAIRRNIYINTIQCGTNPAATTAWKRIARNSEGRYAAIPQNGGVVAISTPYDDKLRTLARDLDRTEMTYGRRSRREAKKATRASASGFAAAAPAASAADRAGAKAKMELDATEDLVALYERDGDAAVDSLDETMLPDELRGKSEAERKEVVAQKKAQREKLKKQILEVEKKRAAFIKDAKKKSKAKPQGFDAEVVDMIKTQGKARGLAM